VLGVPDQTVRKWRREIPEDTPPLELEQMLLDRAAKVRKPRSQVP
jgi:transposase-like protein